MAKHDEPVTAQDAVNLLKRIEAKGVRSVYLGDDASVPATTPETTPAMMQAAPGGAADPGPEPKARKTAPPPDSGGASSDVATSLEALAAEVAGCTQCALHEGRNKTVFGVGTPETKVLFIGEAPGRDEDLKGEPFVGRAGKLLDKILAAIDLDRSQVYISNILKCRPPNNRDPQESEVRCCENYLKQQIALIKPSYICALGRVSAQWLLQTNAPLGAMRSGDYEYEGIPVIATYHPAALLRNPNFKKPCWEDMQKLRDLINAV
jgi:DNA polymerase